MNMTSKCAKFNVNIPSCYRLTVILQIFGTLKFRHRAIAERSVSFKFRCPWMLPWSLDVFFSFRCLFNFGETIDHHNYRKKTTPKIWKIKVNSFPRVRMKLEKQAILCTALNRKPMQAPNFGGRFDQLQLSLWIFFFLSGFHTRSLSPFSIP